jgi:hypothetical protein
MIAAIGRRGRGRSPTAAPSAAWTAAAGAAWKAGWSVAADRARGLWRPLGWSGVLGLACLLIAAALWWGWVRGRDAVAQGLRQEIGQLREKSRTVAPPPHVPDAAEQLVAFHAFFPPRRQISAALGELNRLALAHQLVLASGDYKFNDEKNLRLARYELRLPVRGTYAQVYGLVAAALNAMPSLALDEIVIKRESRLADQVEAQLRFSLYVNQD